MKLNMSLFLLNKESIASNEYDNKAVIFQIWTQSAYSGGLEE